MTLAEVMAETDELKPNQYDDVQKIAWLSKIEGKIYNEIILTHEKDDNTKKTTESIVSDDTYTYADTDTDTDTEDTEDTFGGYTTDDYDTVLIAPDEYCDLYKFYLFAMIDFYTGEYARYANSMVMFNTAYSAYSHWYNRTHKPKSNVLKLF